MSDTALVLSTLGRPAIKAVIFEEDDRSNLLELLINPSRDTDNAKVGGYRPTMSSAIRSRVYLWTFHLLIKAMLGLYGGETKSFRQRKVLQHDTALLNPNVDSSLTTKHVSLMKMSLISSQIRQPLNSLAKLLTYVFAESSA